MRDLRITLAKTTSHNSPPRWTAEFRGIRWEFSSRNDGSADDLKNDAMNALAFMAICAGRGSTANPKRYESGRDYVEFC